MRLTVTLLLVGTTGLAGCSNSAQRDPALGVSTDPSITLSGSAPVTLNPYEIVSSREPWQFGDDLGHLIHSQNYRIYTTIESERILERLPVFYELALEHYTSNVTRLPRPESPLVTYLFQTRSQWQAKATEMLPDQARMFSNLGRGGFTTKGTAVLYYIDRRGNTRDTFAIAAHEGWHQYTQQTFKHQLPVWLEEGMATYMEGYRVDRETGIPTFHPHENYERRATLRDAVRRGRMIPLNDLLTRTPQSFLTNSKDSLLTYYAQVWALTTFLAEGEDGRYREALETLLRDAAEGRMVSRMLTSTVTAGARRLGGSSGVRVGPAVLQEYFNRDMAEFEAQFLAYVQTLDQPRPR